MKHKATSSVGVLLCLLGLGACGGEITDDSEFSQSEEILAKNGMKYNGMKYNGLKYNGASFNAMQYAGLKYNGMGLSGVAYASYTGASMSNLQINKTTLSASLPNGVMRAGKELLGATLNGVLSNGATVRVGIANVVQTIDPEIIHYRLEVYDTSTSKWYAACDGTGFAVPIAAIWKSDGSRAVSSQTFTFACVDSGAIGKCVMLGYKPWSRSNYHQACVRMIRGDYCGTGVSYTRDGTSINLFDNIGVQKDDRSKYSLNWIFDAEWNESGAVCISFSGRSTTLEIACRRPSTCSSSATNFRTGVLLKNWIAQAYSSSYSYTTYTSNGVTYGNINFNGTTNVSIDDAWMQYYGL